jgi:mycothiol synthase
VVEIATFSSYQLDASSIAAAQLLAALEEDETGRQPISPQLWDDLKNRSTTAGELADQSHVFFMDKHSTVPVLGYACVSQADLTAQFTMRPGTFDKAPAFATALAEQGLASHVWAKGVESAAAASGGKPIRTLVLMSQDLQTQTAGRTTQIRQSQTSCLDDAYQIRTFRPDSDSTGWLAINATIFADLPDQANVTSADLQRLLTAPWFDPQGFFVAETNTAKATELKGFHWTKVNPTERLNGRVSGEVYVLGVTKSAAGSGLAAALLTEGLTRFGNQGIRHAHLYVESTNTRAQHFYQTQGFTTIDEDRLLRLTR